MRRLYLIILLEALSFLAFSQRNHVNDKNPAKRGKETYDYEKSEFKLERDILNNALNYKDFTVATQALYRMISLRPDIPSLKDSLAYLYFNTGHFIQATMVGKSILNDNPDHQKIREVVAISEQNLGAYKQSLEDYEALYALTKNSLHLYQIATLQFSLKRYGECATSIEQILADPNINNLQVNITIAEDQTQKVPLKAAVYNMKGALAMDMNEKDLARKNLEEALKLFPDFKLASMNLQSLNNQYNGNESEK